MTGYLARVWPIAATRTSAGTSSARRSAQRPSAASRWRQASRKKRPVRYTAGTTRAITAHGHRTVKTGLPIQPTENLAAAPRVIVHESLRKGRCATGEGGTV